jgi:hypothetical protein
MKQIFGVTLSINKDKGNYMTTITLLTTGTCANRYINMVCTAMTNADHSTPFGQIGGQVLTLFS